MCGIAGAWVKQPLPEVRIQACLRQMATRGPDHQAEEVIVNPGSIVHMLHSRLTIIDRDPRANQPMRFEDLIGAVNGELYNYKEVKTAMPPWEWLGRFRTASDTEVFLAALTCWGIMSALDKMEGMWAAAVYDESKDILFLIRDRFGEKPLYYCEDKTGLYWGSEPKYIFTLLGRRLPVSKEQVSRFLTLGYKSLYKSPRANTPESPRTFYRGLREVEPGSVMEWRKPGQCSRKQLYWDEDKQRQQPNMTFEDAVTGVRDRLIRSVGLRLRADFPIAFCLSGGIDSNAILAIAQKECGYTPHAFHVRLEDPRYAEHDLVAEAREAYRCPYTEVIVNADSFLANLRIMVRAHDAPVLTLAYYVQWLLLRKVKEHGYRIVASGTGADELLSGYYDHHVWYQYEMYRQKEGGAPGHANRLRAWREYVLPYVRNPHLRQIAPILKNPAFRDHIYLGAAEFAEFLIEPLSDLSFHEEQYDSDLLRNRMQNELFHESVPVILHEDDRNAMSLGIENRSPFLDRDLYEFCRRIPTKHLMRQAYTKAPLREAVRGLVPDSILNSHRKVGFNAPVEALLSAEVMAWLEEDSPLYEFVHKEKVLDFAKKQQLKNSESKFLFSLISTKMWLEAEA